MRHIFLLLFALSASFAFGQSKSEDFHLDKEYKLNPSGKLSLTSSDAKVWITGSARNTAHVKIDREVTTKGWVFGHEEFSVNVSEQNGDLEIRERSSGTVGMVGYHSERYTIKIELPEGASLSIKGDDGDYEIKNINGAISMSLDDADVNLLGCTGSDFRFQLDDGDLTMDQGKGKLDIDVDDGDVEIRNAQFESVIADVDDGDLIIESSLAENGNYQITAQDGMVSFTILQGGGLVDVRHDDAHVIADGKFQVLEESESRTKLRLSSGTAQVNIRADDARVRLAAR